MILLSKALAAFAAFLVQGVGTAQDIDNGMKLGTNQPMGPLQLADFIGTHFIVLLLCCVATSLCTASLADFIGIHFIMLLLCCALLVRQSAAYACMHRCIAHCFIKCSTVLVKCT